jgi:hypothetical protein
MKIDKKILFLFNLFSGKLFLKRVKKITIYFKKYKFLYK